TRDPGPPAGRDDGGGEHPDRRGLAGAVGTQQAEHLAGGDLKVDGLHGLDAAGVGLAETANVDHRRVGGIDVTHPGSPLSAADLRVLVDHTVVGAYPWTSWRLT